MKEGWIKIDEEWMKNDEGWMKNDEGSGMNDEEWWFQAVEGFCRRTDGRTDICDCRVAFATEKYYWIITREESNKGGWNVQMF